MSNGVEAKMLFLSASVQIRSDFIRQVRVYPDVMHPDGGLIQRHLVVNDRHRLVGHEAEAALIEFRDVGLYEEEHFVKAMELFNEKSYLVDKKERMSALN